MTTTTERFWAKVFYRDFIKHYRKMTDEEIVRDVRQSMDDLEEQVDDTDTFGSQMVRWAVERADQYPMAVENGKKGGRPSSLPKSKQEVIDFAAANGLDVVDAGDWYEAHIVEKGGTALNGERIKNWKGLLKGWCKNEQRKRAKHG